MLRTIDTAPGSPLRDYYVGASEVPGILGLSPYADQTPRAIWRRKRGLDKAREGTIHIQIGHALEPVIVDALCAEIPALATGVKPAVSYVRDACPRLAAAPDVVDSLDAPRVLGESKAWGHVWRDIGALEQLRAGIVPNAGRVLCAYVQVQAQLLATGAEVAYLAWLSDDRRLEHAEITPSAPWHRVIADGVAGFARALDLEIEPHGVGADRDALLREPIAAAEPPVALDHMGPLLDELAGVRAAIDSAERRRREIEAAIVEALGQSARGVSGDWKISRTLQTRSTIDARALREAHPDIADTYTRQGEPFGVLRITRSRS